MITEKGQITLPFEEEKPMAGVAFVEQSLPSWEQVDQALEAAATPYGTEASKKKSVFPGAVLLVGHRGEVVYHKAVGCRSVVPTIAPTELSTVYDVSSLTKALVTTTLVMQLVDRRLIDVDRRLSRIFQTFGTLGKETMTVRHLLAHCAGFPAIIPFHKMIARADKGERWGIMTSRGAVEMVYGEIFRSKLDLPPGKQTVYSDIGFMLLGAIVEICNGGQHLDKIALKSIFKPLELRSTGFIDLSKVKRRGIVPVSDMIAPTLDCPWRGRVLCGEVHDDNAWAMGGIAGHAGLFSTAQEIHKIARELINCYHGRGKLVSKETVRQFWTRDTTVSGSTWALGWDTPSEQGSSSGDRFSADAVGHLGYTGCSVWIDPKREIDVVLLSNRIHPSDQNLLIREFRPQIHNLVMEALGY
jgi:CubicO group peptidase (beta-lactamase class C family)